MTVGHTSIFHIQPSCSLRFLWNNQQNALWCKNASNKYFSPKLQEWLSCFWILERIIASIGFCLFLDGPLWWEWSAKLSTNIKPQLDGPRDWFATTCRWKNVYSWGCRRFLAVKLIANTPIHLIHIHTLHNQLVTGFGRLLETSRKLVVKNLLEIALFASRLQRSPLVYMHGADS